MSGRSGGPRWSEDPRPDAAAYAAAGVLTVEQLRSRAVALGVDLEQEPVLLDRLHGLIAARSLNASLAHQRTLQAALLAYLELRAAGTPREWIESWQASEQE